MIRLPLLPRRRHASDSSHLCRLGAGRYLLPALLVLPSMLAAADPRNKNVPTQPSLVVKAGSLVLVGGGRIPNAVRDRFVELAGGKTAKLVVIPTASGRVDQGEIPPNYLMLRGQNVASVDLLHTRNRDKADDAEFVKPLTQATGVWLTGGDQSKLTQSYLNTGVVRELKKVLERGGVIGGTSAGASVVSSLMITGGVGKAELGEGFGFVPDIVVDQHFTNRNRMGRLQGILTEHPDMLGLGIDEQTAAVFQGQKLSVLGEASVWVCLSPTPSLPAGVQRLKAGEQIDLAGLSQTLTARWKTLPDRTTVTTAGGMSRDPMPMKGR